MIHISLENRKKNIVKILEKMIGLRKVLETNQISKKIMEKMW